MRLSSRLSDKSENHGTIESFIDWEKYTISPEEETECILRQRTAAGAVTNGRRAV